MQQWHLQQHLLHEQAGVDNMVQLQQLLPHQEAGMKYNHSSCLTFSSCNISKLRERTTRNSSSTVAVDLPGDTCVITLLQMRDTILRILPQDD